MSKTLQNFYKSTLSLDWSVGTGTFYVTTKPTITDGWLVISPNNSALREIVRYTSTGTDANGDYVGVTVRGVGGTTEQTHTVGEPIRMNITAEYWNEMNTDIANIVAAGVPNANTTTMGGVEIATLAEALADTDTGGTGASLVALPSSITAKIKAYRKFGGTGADGALTITSGTTIVDCANAKIKILNYTTLSITGTGKLAFSNPHASGTIVVIRCTGNATLTSSSVPMIDASNMGAAGGGLDIDGTNGISESNIRTNFGVKGSTQTGGAVGSLLTTPIGDSTTLPTQLYSKYPKQFIGAGGGGGQKTVYNTQPDSYTGNNNGGNGGGCLIIEIAGAINFTTTNGISVAGSKGGTVLTATGGSNFAFGGGGGGGGGSCFIFYNTLTAFSGTVNVAGGVGGGLYTSQVGTWNGIGGGGGGSATNAGANGTSGNTPQGLKTGGDGGAGLEVHGLNLEYF